MEGNDVKTVKTGVMGSYGAIGDSFFWGAVKPFASIIGVIFAALGHLAAPLIFLLIYNVSHFQMRIFGFYRGYREGIAIFDVVKQFNFPTLTRRIKYLSVVSVGGLLALFARLKMEALFPGGTWVQITGALLLFIVFFLALKKGISSEMLIYASFLLSVGSSAFF
jgi:mannose/fructose/N-acetylgalactosamine-specific phosphotransferase system component IID